MEIRIHQRFLFTRKKILKTIADKVKVNQNFEKLLRDLILKHFH